MLANGSPIAAWRLSLLTNRGAMHDPVTVTLEREDMERVHELVVARAVNIEASEEIAMQGFGSKGYRRPANAIRAALREEQR